MAAPLYPVVIGTRLVVLAGAAPCYLFASDMRQWAKRKGEPAPNDIAAGSMPSVLVLRTFGNDGGILVPAATVKPGGVLPEIYTLESIVERLAIDRGMAVHALSNQDLESVPAGVRYLDVANDDWWYNFERLSTTARVIVVIATPSTQIGPSFEREMRSLYKRNLTDRVILIAPSTVDDPHCRAANEIRTLLRWPEAQLPPLASYVGADGRFKLHPALGEADPHVFNRYYAGISSGIEDILSRTG